MTNEPDLAEIREAARAARKDVAGPWYDPGTTNQVRGSVPSSPTESSLVACWECCAQNGEATAKTERQGVKRLIAALDPDTVEVLIDTIEEQRTRLHEMADTLTRTANVLLGLPADGWTHSWADLPEVAQHMRTSTRVQMIGEMQLARDRLIAMRNTFHGDAYAGADAAISTLERTTNELRDEWGV